MHKKKLLIAITVIVLLFILIVPLKAPEKVLKIFYPIKYENFVELCAKEYNVDKYLIYAIIKAESNFNEKAVSSKDAKGLMQLMDETAVDISKKMKLNLSNEEISTKLLEADFNIKLGSYYISILLQKYNSIELALVAYNAGSGKLDYWIEQGVLKADGTNIENVPYKETNNYVRKILRDYDIYKGLYKQ